MGLSLRTRLYAIGRAGFASLFLLGGLNKIANFDAMLPRVEAAGLVPALFFLPATVALELGLGLALALGTRLAWQSALGLAAFTLATNAVFHRFWELSGKVAALELSLFFKNVAIAGALVALASVERERSLG
ncbi:MAG: DoxX family membrane protein [Pseudomonadota bacterium]